MKREDVLLIGLPFLLSAIIIFAHYRILSTKNPAAHSRPLISYESVQSIDEKSLTPIAPATALPEQIIGVIAEIPTNEKTLSETVTSLKSQKANTLIIRIGMKINSVGKLIITRSEEVEENLLIRWLKKTTSEVHANGFHTYLLLNLEEDPVIINSETFQQDLEKIVSLLSNVSQQFYVSYFDPGLIVGSPSYTSLPAASREVLKRRVEQTARKFYTGRIGLEVCCGVVEANPEGYNFLSIYSSENTINEKYKEQLSNVMKKHNLEYLLLINVETKSARTLMKKS